MSAARKSPKFTLNERGAILKNGVPCAVANGDIARALNIAATFERVRAALELAETTYSNISTTDFSCGGDKPARDAIDAALAALDAAGAA